jgi:alpha-D-ribose 1-methylphosphonate 5-triphosphate synthase subunit PhnG
MAQQCTNNVEQRQSAMAACAAATAAEVAAAVARLGISDAEDLRAPEVGLVMARGRIGGTGAAFNMGEVSVARAAVRLPSGEVGVAYLMGRDRDKARAAAILDAAWQAARRAEVEAALAPIRQRVAEERALKQRRTAATKVDFFTMVRGEDR